MRSKSASRNYVSARTVAEKRTTGSFTSTYLRLPDKVQFFKPKAGVMILNILPYEVGKGNPNASEGQFYYERTYWNHRGVGPNSDSYLCPRMNSKKPCPICEFRAKLAKETDEESEKLVKDLAPKQRQLFTVVDLKEPDKGPQLWDISFHLFGKLLESRIKDCDEDDMDAWSMFYSTTDGSSLRISFDEKSMGKNNFLEAVSIDLKERKSDPEDEGLALDEMLIEPSYAALRKAFEVEPDAEDDAEAEEEDEKPRGKKSKEVDEEEEEKPRKRSARGDADEEEEEEKPVRGKSRSEPEDDDEDEEEKPARGKVSKKSKDEDDEDDEDEWNEFDKKSKGKDDAEDEDEDEEEEKPRKGAKKSKAKDEDEDDDDEEERPRVKTQKEEEDEDEEEEEKPRKRFGKR